MATIKSLEPESIIEYTQSEESPIFHYNGKNGAIFIKADKTTWLWKNKKVETNSSISYDDDRYNLLFMSGNLKKYDSVYKFIGVSQKYIFLYNTGILPRRIKKGETLGIAFLIPRIESHVLKRTTE